jgi:hypothetical protein
MAHDLIEGAYLLEVVSGRAKRVDDRGIEPAFNSQTGLFGTPGAAQQPARCCHRLLQTLALQDVA